jgi:hypothetical protein
VPKTALPTIPMDTTEEDFVKQAIEHIGEVKKVNKMLDKDSFIKIFKYTGDFAKYKNQALKKQAQEQRVAQF